MILYIIISRYNDINHNLFFYFTTRELASFVEPETSIIKLKEVIVDDPEILFVQLSHISLPFQLYLVTSDINETIKD